MIIEYKENRFCPGKEHYINFLVLKNLCRVLKNRNLFVKFRCTIGSNTLNKMSQPYLSLMTPILGRYISRISRESPFGNCGSINDILCTIASGTLLKVDLESEENIQKNITATTNILIHFLLEKNLGSIKEAEKIGEEVFNLTCEGLFGKGFKDLTTLPEMDKAQLEKIKAMSLHIEPFMDVFDEELPTEEQPF